MAAVENPIELSECALSSSTDASQECIKDSSDVKVLAQNHTGNTIQELMEELGCKSSKCVVEQANVGKKEKDRIWRKAFKAVVVSLRGTYWLNNTEIDTVMSHLRSSFPGFAHGFIHMSDMIAYKPDNAHTFDYAIYAAKEIDFPNELRKGLIDQGLIKADANEPAFASKLSTRDGSPLRYYGIVCNTDTSTGPGQHWFALFISTDSRDPWNPRHPIVRIELFNSAGGGSGNKEFDGYWREQAVKIAQRTGVRCIFQVVTSMQHQNPETGNCGSYSLFYMYARMNKAKPSEFDDPKKRLMDSDMEKFRKVCFRVKDGGKN